MTRAHFQMSGPLVMGDKFWEMSLQAMVLLIVLNIESDTRGVVANPKMQARGTGLGLDALDELYQYGYIADVGGESWLMDTWLNNTRNANFEDRVLDSEAFTSGCMGWEGEPFASRYKVERESRQVTTSHDKFLPNITVTQPVIDNPTATEQKATERETQRRVATSHDSAPTSSYSTMGETMGTAGTSQVVTDLADEDIEF